MVTNYTAFNLVVLATLFGLHQIKADSSSGTLVSILSRSPLSYALSRIDDNQETTIGTISAFGRWEGSINFTGILKLLSIDSQTSITIKGLPTYLNILHFSRSTKLTPRYEKTKEIRLNVPQLFANSGALVRKASKGTHILSRGDDGPWSLHLELDGNNMPSLRAFEFGKKHDTNSLLPAVYIPGTLLADYIVVLP